MLRKGQLVRVMDEITRSALYTGQVVFEGGKVPSFEGELIAVNPTKEEYAAINDDFKALAEMGLAEGVEDGLVYYDEGAERAFWVEYGDLAPVEEEDDLEW